MLSKNHIFIALLPPLDVSKSSGQTFYTTKWENMNRNCVWEMENWWEFLDVAPSQAKHNPLTGLKLASHK